MKSLTSIRLVSLGAAMVQIVGLAACSSGEEQATARLSGLSINKHVIAAYMLLGVIAAIAGVLLTARTGSGQPISGSQGLGLQAIIAVALGGCALGAVTVPIPQPAESKGQP